MLTLKKSKGQSLVEYALVLALVAVLSIPALEGVQGGVDTALGKTSTALNGAGPSGGDDTPPILEESPEEMMSPAPVS